MPRARHQKDDLTMLRKAKFLLFSICHCWWFTALLAVCKSAEGAQESEEGRSPQPLACARFKKWAKRSGGGSRLGQRTRWGVKRNDSRGGGRGHMHALLLCAPVPRTECTQSTQRAPQTCPVFCCVQPRVQPLLHASRPMACLTLLARAFTAWVDQAGMSRCLIPRLLVASPAHIHSHQPLHIQHSHNSRACTAAGCLLALPNVLFRASIGLIIITGSSSHPTTRCIPPPLPLTYTAQRHCQATWMWVCGIASSAPPSSMGLPACLCLPPPDACRHQHQHQPLLPPCYMSLSQVLAYIQDCSARHFRIRPPRSLTKDDLA